MATAWKVVSGGWQKEDSREILAPEHEGHSSLLTLAAYWPEDSEGTHTLTLSTLGSVELG